MPVDPDNAPASIHSMLHTPFLPGWAEALLVGAFGALVIVMLWGRRIAEAIGAIYRFTRDLITRNDSIRSRMDAIETAQAVAAATQAKLIAELGVMNTQMRDVLHAVAPPGQKSYRDMLDELLKNETIATARLRAFAETDATARFECDAHGACIHVNDAMCQLFGMPPERMMKNGWLEAIPTAQRSKVHTAWRHAVANDVPYDQEYDVIVDDTVTPVYAKTTAVPYDGKTLVYLGTASRRGPSHALTHQQAHAHADASA